MTTPDDFRIVRREATASSHDADALRGRLAHRSLPTELRDLKASASTYQLDNSLETAINMAIAVGAPLLLTGAPGTGKTQVAHYLAWYFDTQVFAFQTRSTSTADDLKFEFDAVAYLRWAQSKDEAKMDRSAFLHPRALWRCYAHDRPSVLLIDEIDKAPRDFPNDLLHELDQQQFEHPFDDTTIITPQHNPIVVITSNAERRLPDAFLRRCMFHHIELTPEFVRRVVKARLAAFPGLAEDTREQAIKLFLPLLTDEQLTKRPSTAELLNWLAILDALGTRADELDRLHANTPGIGALIKTEQDRQQLR